MTSLAFVVGGRLPTVLPVSVALSMYILRPQALVATRWLCTVVVLFTPYSYHLSR